MAILPLTSPTTSQIGDTAPALYEIALQVDISDGNPPTVPDTVAAAHPVPISSASTRHEILPDEKTPPEVSVPTRPPPQHIHAVPLYPTDVILIPGNTEPAVDIAFHPVAPVRSFV